MNLLRGSMGEDGWVVLGEQRLRLARRTTFRGDVVVGIRPEAVSAAAGLGDDVLEMPVVLSEMLGSDVMLHLDPGVRSVHDVAGELDDIEAEQRFIARVPPSLRPAAGERVRLRVDMERVHLFDPSTERVIRR
jgi:multiple sugar transport system ATP-binding protein